MLIDQFSRVEFVQVDIVGRLLRNLDDDLLLFWSECGLPCGKFFQTLLEFESQLIQFCFRLFGQRQCGLFVFPCRGRTG